MTFKCTCEHTQEAPSWAVLTCCNRCERRILDALPQDHEARVDAAMKHAGTIYSGRVSFDPYAMHRAVESIPADILREIADRTHEERP